MMALRTADLGFAQHHRIQAGGDAEGVAHGIMLRQHVQVRAQLGVIQLVEIGQELRTGVERIGGIAGGVQLGTVAGGQDGCFVAAF